MSEEKGNLLIRLAQLLVLAVLLIVFHNWWGNFQAGNASSEAVNEIYTVIETQVNVVKDSGESTERPLQMQETVIDGYAYIGYLHIPVLGLELPVMSTWSDEGLKIAPCRHFGAVVTDDLVIAAHNYRRHFGALGTLKEGDSVSFIEMDGYVNDYIVQKVVTLQATAIQDVISNEHDLVLYTCTTGGQKRLAAYCKRVKSDTEE